MLVLNINTKVTVLCELYGKIFLEFRVQRPRVQRPSVRGLQDDRGVLTNDITLFSVLLREYFSKVNNG